MNATLDPNALTAGFSALYIALIVFGVILSILWLLVPFAIFGIKPLLRTLIAEQRKANDGITNLAHQWNATYAERTVRDRDTVVVRDRDPVIVDDRRVPPVV